MLGFVLTVGDPTSPAHLPTAVRASPRTHGVAMVRRLGTAKPPVSIVVDGHTHRVPCRRPASGSGGPSMCGLRGAVSSTSGGLHLSKTPVRRSAYRRPEFDRANRSMGLARMD